MRGEEEVIKDSNSSEIDVTSQHIPNPLTSGIRSLPKDIQRILRSYDFESMPLCKSHEENFAASEDLENLRKKLESCRIETKLTTIHDKNDHTKSSTSDDNRKTVISSILEQFNSLLEENSVFDENFSKLGTEPSSNNALQCLTEEKPFRCCPRMCTSQWKFSNRMRLAESLRSSCDINNSC